MRDVICTLALEKKRQRLFWISERRGASVADMFVKAEVSAPSSSNHGATTFKYGKIAKQCG